MSKNSRDDAAKRQLGLFETLTDVDDPKPDESTTTPHTCETCRHWHKNAPVYDRLTGKYTESKWHHCAQLYVVTKREYGSPIEAGTAMKPEEAQALMLTNIDYLNTAPFFSCDEWEQRMKEGDRERTGEECYTVENQIKDRGDAVNIPRHGYQQRERSW